MLKMTAFVLTVLLVAVVGISCKPDDRVEKAAYYRAAHIRDHYHEYISVGGFWGGLACKWCGSAPPQAEAKLGGAP